MQKSWGGQLQRWGPSSFKRAICSARLLLSRVRSKDLAAAAFGAKRTWFLVNGSSGGLHAAIIAAAQLYQHRWQREHGSDKGEDGSSRSYHCPAPVVAVPRNAHR